MIDRNNAPAGKLVPEVRVPTAKELREQKDAGGRPMRRSSLWLLEAGDAMCDELITLCKQLQDRLDKEDSDSVYLALAAKCAAERLQRVIETIGEQEK